MGNGRNRLNLKKDEKRSKIKGEVKKTVKCANCGAQIPELGKFCSYCGTEASFTSSWEEKQPAPEIHVHHHYYEQEQQSVPEPRVIYETRQMKSPKSRLVLLVLYLFFGVAGFHKFYSGKMGMGFLYLFTGGLFGIGLFFDFFSIFFGTPRDAQNLPILWN